jgi:hypothetical protein
MSGMQGDQVDPNNQPLGQGNGFDWGNFASSGGLGGLGQMFGGMFQMGQSNPASGAMNYLDGLPNQLKQYFQPYINAGQGAMGQLQDQYGQLTQNPGGFINQMGQQFQQSPGYQFNVQQQTNAANRAAAAGGMAGSPQEQQNLASTISGTANQDYYNWLSHALGAYGEGLNGLQGLNQMGYNASTGLAEDLTNIGQSQAQLQYAGQADQNQSEGGGFGSVVGGLASLASYF